jgi:hypothetical protein
MPHPRVKRLHNLKGDGLAECRYLQWLARCLLCAPERENLAGLRALLLRHQTPKLTRRCARCACQAATPRRQCALLLRPRARDNPRRAADAGDRETEVRAEATKPASRGTSPRTEDPAAQCKAWPGQPVSTCQRDGRNVLAAGGATKSGSGGARCRGERAVRCNAKPSPVDRCLPITRRYGVWSPMSSPCKILRLHLEKSKSHSIEKPS